MAMPGFNFTVDGNLAETFRKIPPEYQRQALTDAGQVIMAATKIGFMRRVGPDGEEWAGNAPWYWEAKGKTSPLSGPTQKAISSGKYAGRYEFAQVNGKRMANCLTKTVNMSTLSVKINYTTSAKERAAFNQSGGEGKIVLNPVGGGRQKIIQMDVPARPHLGIAEEYRRLGTKTDTQHIIEVFDQMIDRVLK